MVSCYSKRCCSPSEDEVDGLGGQASDEMTMANNDVVPTAHGLPLSCLVSSPFGDHWVWAAEAAAAAAVDVAAWWLGASACL